MLRVFRFDKSDYLHLLKEPLGAVLYLKAWATHNDYRQPDSSSYCASR